MNFKKSLLRGSEFFYVRKFLLQNECSYYIIGEKGVAMWSNAIYVLT